MRVWVNLGIAHAFKGLYEEAASFYLNALSFRPDAKHIWSYLHTSFLSLRSK
ncbi:MAG: tetratricopeptide repeat protein [Bdellovibrionales bacterium]|nr:tetratricopeptide repeat protein [Bdellovibrionales bacterium]